MSAGPTQTQHPWRATARTGFAVVVALLTIVPYALAEVHLHETVVGAQVIAVAGAVTRVLALPVVQDFLADYAPWLSADGRPLDR